MITDEKTFEDVAREASADALRSGANKREMDALEMDVVAYIAKHYGYSAKQCAEHFGITPTRVKEIKNANKDEIARIRKLVEREKKVKEEAAPAPIGEGKPGSGVVLEESGDGKDESKPESPIMQPVMSADDGEGKNFFVSNMKEMLRETEPIQETEFVPFYTFWKERAFALIEIIEQYLADNINVPRVFTGELDAICQVLATLTE